jgi:hypothetical protein
MGFWLAEEGPVYHMQEYAIVKKKDGNYEYVAWNMDKKKGRFCWLRGPVLILEDTLCLTGISSEGDEQTVENDFELQIELAQFSKWEKTKYYCALVGGNMASLLKSCHDGKFIDEDSQEYKTVQEMFKKHDITLKSQ